MEPPCVEPAMLRIHKLKRRGDAMGAARYVNVWLAFACRRVARPCVYNALQLLLQLRVFISCVAHSYSKSESVRRFVVRR
jgi:hypothetical protein